MNVRRYIVLLSKISVKKLSTITLSVIFILLTGVTEEEAIELYMNKLQTFSVHIISKEQTLFVKKYYLENSNKSPNLEERHIVRKAFNQQKKKLKKDWENFFNPLYSYKDGTFWCKSFMHRFGSARDLTQALNVKAVDKPIMADLLSSNDSNLAFEDLIVQVSPGIDLIPSRIDNATLDNIIMLKRFNLAKVYKDHIDSCKNNYDLVIIDCPPALGQSVTAVALSCDTVIAPVTPEEFSLSGLTLTYQEINDIRRTFDKKIGFRVLLNKFDVRTSLSHEVIQTLMKHEIFSELMYKIYIRNSQEFPNAIARGDSIFDVLKGTSAKEDIDLLLSEMFQCIPAKMEKN